MEDAPDKSFRSTIAQPDQKGRPTFDWTLTDPKNTDAVKLILQPLQTVPIIFVPGIMGSNLCSLQGAPVWLLNSLNDQPFTLAWYWAPKGADKRQVTLHPARTKVFGGGDVPDEIVGTIGSKSDYISRGWGEVAETSYHKFLLWLEGKMNQSGIDPALWPDFTYTAVSPTPEPGHPAPKKKLFPGIPMQMQGLPMFGEEGKAVDAVRSDDLLHRAKFRFPVYACGYNWLAGNDAAAIRLEERINKVIAENNRDIFKCSQVILVTHSMGGLVARACVQRPGVEEKVVGVLHGVMPSIGAAVAYRRCKVGMKDEDFGPGLVIGPTGQEVTAVFAQAPGALQLLPSEEYGTNWLRIKDDAGKVIVDLPKADPYSEIYLCRDKWWGLVNDDWLKPKNGKPIDWDEYASNIENAQRFHKKLAGKFHDNTYVFYGAGNGKQASFQKITWSLRKGSPPGDGTKITPGQTVSFNHDRIRGEGAATIYVGGRTVEHFIPSMNYYSSGSTVKYETSNWEIVCKMQDSIGDGTVPANSGAAPRLTGGGAIRQQFRLKGFSHEPAYKDEVAQCVAHYCLTKIVALAKVNK
jgi:pimeloyl-ACP methyl ester carboxylesterase